jgi:hypothetical protein
MLFFSSFVSVSASASLSCGQALIAEVGDHYYDAEGLLRYFEATPQSFVGALKLRTEDGSSRTVVIVNGSLPGRYAKGMSPAGNDLKRVLTSKSLVLNEGVARRSNKIVELVTHAGRWASIGLLANELLNPGMLPNNVPFLAPGLVAGLFTPNLIGNLVALKHRWFSKRPQTQEDLIPHLTSYLAAYRVPKKRWMSRLVHSWRGYPLLTPLQVVAVTNPDLVGTPQDRQKLMLRLEATLTESEGVSVEVMDSTSLIWELTGEK